MEFHKVDIQLNESTCSISSVAALLKVLVLHEGIMSCAIFLLLFCIRLTYLCCRIAVLLLSVFISAPTSSEVCVLESPCRFFG